MNHDKSIELPGSGTLTRRQMVKVLTAASAGMAVSSPISGLAVVGETNTGNGARMAAAMFFESHKAAALQRALRYAGDDGFVASMPQLLHARANADYGNIIWNTWFTANSEENVVTTPQGNHVVVAVHGGGIFAQPARFERSLRADLSRHNSKGLTGRYAAKITKQEASDVLEGKLPDGSEISVYPFAEFKRGIKDLAMRYAVVLDFEMARNSKRGYEPFDVLTDDPIMIVRAGGVEPLASYLGKARARHGTKLMGTWHPYNWIDPNQPQSRILTLGGNKGGIGSEGKDPDLGWGYDSDGGMSTAWLGGMARYVAVAPRDVSASLRDLNFEL